MSIEIEKINREMSKMKKRMGHSEKRLYGIISNLIINRNDLDVLLTFAFVNGKQEGMDEVMDGVTKGTNDET